MVRWTVSMEWMGTLTAWTATLILALSPSRPSVCPSMSTDASPTCWCCICAGWRRVRGGVCHTTQIIPFYFVELCTDLCLCSWKRGGAEKEFVGELVSAGDWVRDRLRGGSGQQEGSDREGPPQAGALCECTSSCCNPLTRAWPKPNQLCLFLPGSHPHRAISGRVEGVRVGQHRRRTFTGCQPKLHPGRLNSSLCLHALLFFHCPFRLQTCSFLCFTACSSPLYRYLWG